MPAKVPSANSLAELLRAKNHEKESRHDVNQRQERMPGKNLIEGDELCGSGIGRDRWRITMKRNWIQDGYSASGYRDSNHREKNSRAPHHSPETNSWLHAW